MFKKISTFIGEVKAELRKASWPWDPDPKGFRWIDCHDHEQSVLSYLLKPILKVRERALRER